MSPVGVVQTRVCPAGGRAKLARLPHTSTMVCMSTYGQRGWFRSIKSGASRWGVSWITISSPWSVLTSHGQEAPPLARHARDPRLPEIQPRRAGLARQRESRGAAVSVEIR